MLSSIRLGNFKSWADTGNISLKPITGFFGANSSGKTSLLQAILLLKQTAESSDRGLPLQFGDKNSLVNLGDFHSVIHRHADENEMTFSLNWQQDEPLVVEDPKGRGKKDTVVENANIAFSTHIRGENGAAGKALKLVVPDFSYRIGNVTFEMRRKTEKPNEFELHCDSDTFEFIRSQGRVWPLPPPAKFYGFPDQVRAYYQNASFLADLELAFENQMRQVYYLGPLRAYPERTYTWAGAQPSDMGQTGEQSISAILSSRDRGATMKRGKGKKRATLEEYVAEWLQKLGLIAEFRVDAVAKGSQIFQVKVRKAVSGPEVLITDVGFGVSQILPVVVLCFYVPEGSTIILEQPEIHLHPAVQASLADVLIDAYHKRRVQILVESHSEHLLRRLQRRIAEKELSKDAVAFYFCEAGDRGSKMIPLELDLFGRISNWPQEFFGDEFGEIAATQEAIIQRRQETQE
jgi:predicted ATPase